jgi:hypothetical protein
MGHFGKIGDGGIPRNVQTEGDGDFAGVFLHHLGSEHLFQGNEFQTAIGKFNANLGTTRNGGFDTDLTLGGGEGEGEIGLESANFRKLGAEGDFDGVLGDGGTTVDLDDLGGNAKRVQSFFDLGGVGIDVTPIGLALLLIRKNGEGR